jgi:hypothetical protein
MYTNSNALNLAFYFWEIDKINSNYLPIKKINKTKSHPKSTGMTSATSAILVNFIDVCPSFLL